MNDDEFDRRLREAAGRLAGDRAPERLRTRVSAITSENPRGRRRRRSPSRLLAAAAALASIVVLAGFATLFVGARPHEIAGPLPSETKPAGRTTATGTSTLHLTIVVDPPPQRDFVTSGMQEVPIEQWARLTASDGHVAARWHPGVDPDPTVPAGTYEFEAWPTYRDDWAEGGSSWRDGGDRPIGVVNLGSGSNSVALHLAVGWARPWSLQPSASGTLAPAPQIRPLSRAPGDASPDTWIAAAVNVLHAEEALVGQVAAPIAVQSVDAMTSDEALAKVPELQKISLAVAWPSRVAVVRATGTFGRDAGTGYLVLSATDGRLLAFGPTGALPSNGPDASSFPLALRLGGRTVAIADPAECNGLAASDYYLRFCRALASPSDWRSITPVTTDNRAIGTPELMARITRAYLAGDEAICDDPLVLRLSSITATAPDPSASPVPFAVGCRRQMASDIAVGHVEIIDPTSTDNSDPLRVMFRRSSPPTSPSSPPTIEPSPTPLPSATDSSRVPSASEIVQGPPPLRPGGPSIAVGRRVIYSAGPGGCAGVLYQDRGVAGDLCGPGSFPLDAPAVVVPPGAVLAIDYPEGANVRLTDAATAEETPLSVLATPVADLRSLPGGQQEALPAGPPTLDLKPRIEASGRIVATTPTIPGDYVVQVAGTIRIGDWAWSGIHFYYRVAVS